MKTKIIFLFLTISFIICSSTQQKGTPVEGVWKLVYAQWTNGSSRYQLPGNTTGSAIKIWSKGYFNIVGQFKIDTATIDSYVGGTYKLEGNKYEENIQYHASKSAVDCNVRMLLEIRNDTLIHSWPADKDWKINKSTCNTEKYIRLK